MINQIVKTNGLSLINRIATIALLFILLILVLKFGPNFKIPDIITWGYLWGIGKKLLDYEFAAPIVFFILGHFWQAIFLHAISWRITRGQIEIIEENWLGSKVKHFSKYEILESQIAENDLFWKFKAFTLKLKLIDGKVLVSPRFATHDEAYTALELFEN